MPSPVGSVPAGEDVAASARAVPAARKATERAPIANALRIIIENSTEYRRKNRAQELVRSSEKRDPVNNLPNPEFDAAKVIDHLKDTSRSTEGRSPDRVTTRRRGRFTGVRRPRTDARR